MKTFAGIKHLIDIRDQCRAEGLLWDDKAFRTRGSDHIVISGGGARVFFNTFNGRFFGTTDTGVSFNSDSTEHEECPWFQSLLAFFYTESSAQMAPRKPSGIAYTVGGVALAKG